MGIVLPPGLSLTSPPASAAAHGSTNIVHHGGGHNSIITSSHQVMRTRSPHSKYRGPQGTEFHLRRRGSLTFVNLRQFGELAGTTVKIGFINIFIFSKMSYILHFICMWMF